MPVYRRGFHRAALREQLFTLGGGHAKPLVERAGIEPVFLLWLSHFSPQGPTKEPSHIPGFPGVSPSFRGARSIICLSIAGAPASSIPFVCIRHSANQSAIYSNPAV